MQHIVKKIRIAGIIAVMSLCFVTLGVNAQTPDDDPGIGGPGSGGNTPGDDGGPVVPLDRDLSIALIAVGVAYGYKKMKEKSLLGIN